MSNRFCAADNFQCQRLLFAQSVGRESVFVCGPKDSRRGLSQAAAIEAMSLHSRVRSLGFEEPSGMRLLCSGRCVHVCACVQSIVDERLGSGSGSPCLVGAFPSLCSCHGR